MFAEETEDAFFVRARCEFVQVLMARAIDNPEFFRFSGRCE